MAQPKYRMTQIRAWRKHRNLKVAQLADIIDMTHGHLSMLERGERGYTQETLEKIAEALGVTTGQLLNEVPAADGEPRMVRIDVPEDIARDLIAYRDGLLRGRGK